MNIERCSSRERNSEHCVRDRSFAHGARHARMKNGLSILLALACSIGAAYAGERAASLVNSFQVMCTIEPLDFASSDARAAVMKLPVHKDLQKPPDASGYFIHSKSWILSLTTGPHEYVVSEARGPKGDAKSCGIGAPDVDGNDVRAELIAAAKLGPPIRETVSDDGKRRITVWSYGPDGEKLMLVDGTPKQQPGIYLNRMKEP